MDFARYALPVADDLVLKNEWDYADVQAFHDALKPYRIAGIFYGHTHVRAVFAWRGPKPDPRIAQRVGKHHNAARRECIRLRQAP